ncbi:MAG: hypothetical protein QOH56_2826 [Pseudonocardiales bacterium]|jgi:DNA-binding CsgD family transcriptional regulator|nr:hypothetical protein [Pseudonocardiales bacterium]
MYVSLSTLDRAVRLVAGLGDLQDPAEFGDRVLPGLAELIGCDVLTYNEVGVGPGQVSYQDWPSNSLQPETRETFSRHVGEHPAVNHYRRTGDGTPVMISDFLGTSDFHRLALYAEFFRPIPVEHQLSMSLDGAGSTVVGFALNRSNREFNETERAILAILRGPLRDALIRARLRKMAGMTGVAGDPGRKLPPELLSLRELQILRLVAMGRTNGAIAHAMSISPRTVAKHLENIYRKLNVSSRAAAVAIGAAQLP